MTGEDERTVLWSVAEALADAAGPATLALFRSSGLVADSKSETFDPVTVADRDAEEKMRGLLEDLRPDDGIVGEEFSPVVGTSGWTWLLDPIDGTRGYISGTPTWGILIALSDETGPKLGVIDQPFTKERFMGGLGRAAYDGPMGASPLSVRTGYDLADAVLFTTFPEVGTPEEGAAFRRVADKVRLVRYGTDCYAYGLLALGQIDLVIEAGLQPYDIAAPIAVIEAAGGMVTDWTGGPAHHGGQVLAAATPALHAAALDLLRGSA